MQPGRVGGVVGEDPHRGQLAGLREARPNRSSNRLEPSRQGDGEPVGGDRRAEHVAVRRAAAPTPRSGGVPPAVRNRARSVSVCSSSASSALLAAVDVERGEAGVRLLAGGAGVRIPAWCDAVERVGRRRLRRLRPSRRRHPRGPRRSAPRRSARCRPTPRGRAFQEVAAADVHGSLVLLMSCRDRVSGRDFEQVRARRPGFPAARRWRRPRPARWAERDRAERPPLAVGLGGEQGRAAGCPARCPARASGPASRAVISGASSPSTARVDLEVGVGLRVGRAAPWSSIPDRWSRSASSRISCARIGRLVGSPARSSLSRACCCTRGHVGGAAWPPPAAAPRRAGHATARTPAGAAR